MARRVFGENDHMTLGMRSTYASALCEDPDATRDDLREAVTTLEDTARIARRVLGEAHPTVEGIEMVRRTAQRVLEVRESPDA